MGHKAHISFVSELTNLKKLEIDQPIDAISFAALGKLEECRLRKGATIGQLHDAPALVELALDGTRIADCTGIVNLCRLKILRMDQTSAQSLDGIQALSLQTLVLNHNNRLKSVAALRGMKSLEFLEIDACRGIADMGALGELTGLRRFEIEVGPALPSFDIFAASTSLQRFVLQSTLLDCDSCSIAPFTAMHSLEWFQLYAGPTKGFGAIRGTRMPRRNFVTADAASRPRTGGA